MELVAVDRGAEAGERIERKTRPVGAEREVRAGGAEAARRPAQGGALRSARSLPRRREPSGVGGTGRALEGLADRPPLVVVAPGRVRFRDRRQDRGDQRRRRRGDSVTVLGDW